MGNVVASSEADKFTIGSKYANLFFGGVENDNLIFASDYFDSLLYGFVEAGYIVYAHFFRVCRFSFIIYGSHFIQVCVCLFGHIGIVSADDRRFIKFVPIAVDVIAFEFQHFGFYTGRGIGNVIYEEYKAVV